MSNLEALHGEIIGSGEFRYQVDAHWGKLDPSVAPVENCHDFAMDKKGRIFMATDHPQNNVIIYDKQGNFLDAWGTAYPGAHGIEIAEENGEEVIYLIDSGWLVNKNWDGVSTDKWDSPFNKMVPQSGVIAKLTLDGRLIYSIGHPQTLGIYEPDMPFNPTDIAITDNGDFYVTDGYGSDFVLHFDSQGRYIRHWGGHANRFEHHNLSNAHGIAIDKRNPADPHLLVSSRAQQCLKQFKLDGTYRGTIETPGAWIHGPVFNNDHFFAAVCWSHIDGKNADNSGFISVFDQYNKVIANLGAHPPQYSEGELQTMSTDWQLFDHVHGLLVDEEENLYVGQWNAGNTYPIKLNKI